MFGDEFGVPDVHLDDRNVLVDGLDGGFGGEIKNGGLVSELVDLVERITHGEGDLGGIVDL